MGRRLANNQLNDLPLLQQLGAQLKATRKQLGLTMEQLSRSSGVSRVTLQRIEAGASSVSSGALASVSIALGIPLQLQMTNQGTMPDQISPQDFPGLLSIAWQLNPETKLSRQEAWSLYLQNRRHLSKSELSTVESNFISSLEREFGDIGFV